MPGVNVTVQAMPAVATARAGLAGVVISADGTVRETFGGSPDRFDLADLSLPIRWMLSPQGLALATWLGTLAGWLALVKYLND
jgi:hypothetical protein